MKKRFLIGLTTLVACGMLYTPATAQTYSNSIGADPISLAFGVLNVTYEHKVAPSNSFSIFASYYSIVDWSAYGIGGTYRWYLDVGNDKQALEGLSLGPLVGIAFWSWNGLYYSYTGGASIIIGGNASYKWVFGGGFVVEPNLTLAFNAAAPSGFSGYHNIGLGVNLGYAWR